MKALFDEYGSLIVESIVALALIGIIWGMWPTIKEFVLTVAGL